MTGLPLFTAAQVREMDAAVIASGVDAYTLMHRAGAAAFACLQQRWPSVRAVLIICGTGNNGGDGYVVAELAQRAGLQVEVLELDDANLRGPAAQARAAAVAAGVLPQRFDVDVMQRAVTRFQGRLCIAVDAILGTGISGGLRPNVTEAVHALNNSGLPVLALDLPTGVHPDTGAVADCAVRAQLTISFIGRKQGLFTGAAPDYTGECRFDDLGVAERLPISLNASPAARAVGVADVTTWLAPRPRASHKGSAGRVLIIGGDTGFGGAALMTAEAALRTGAGTVTLLTRADHVGAVLARCPEVMVKAVEQADEFKSASIEKQLEHASVVAIGPGLGRSGWSVAALAQVLRVAASHHIPLVLDADALNLLAEQQPDWKTLADPAFRQQWVLTPHPGEAARLLRVTTRDIQNDRFAAVLRLMTESGTVCLLKGAGTLLAYPGQSSLDVCTEGNPGMASGGMGDVLTGIIAALIAQDLPAARAAAAGACIHGEAADLAVQAAGERGLRATDLMSYIRKLVN